MKIAQVAPLFESVPPRLYGGTERVIFWLTEELIAKGHDVTLFASGDSQTNATLVPIIPEALRLDSDVLVDKTGFHFYMLEEVFKHSQEFDLIHFHFDYWHLPYLRMLKTPSLTTLHARLDYQPLSKILERYVDFPAVSISQAQRKPAPWLNWQETIYHGLPKQLFSINENPSNYILFLGRLCPEKRPDRAIEIAQRAGIPLKIAAKVDPLDRNYFSNVIEPLLNGPSVEYIGEVNDQQKQQLIGNALALIHPIEFPEPFGLVMIEAMACGTPTVAFRTGSIPEVIDHGVTGFIVDDIESAVAALKNISSLDRRHCRQVFEERFSASRMADEYIKVYEQLIKLYSPSSPLDQLSSNLESKSNFVPSKA